MRKNGLTIMAKLFLLVGNLIPILILAVINGSLGFLSAISITVLGAVAIAKLLGFFTSISYTLLFVLIISMGILRGVLRYFEQYSNHYIAFKLLAVLRNKIFTKLRELCPAKLENKQKGAIISMITADIEILEVFYAHTISPICIAIVVSIIMLLFVSAITTPIYAIYMLFAYVILGLLIPVLSSRYLSEDGVKYRDTFTKFNGFLMDTMKGNREIILHNRQQEKQQQCDDYSALLAEHAENLARKTSYIEAISSALIVILNLFMILLSIVLLQAELIHIGQAIVAVVTLMSSFGPVLALNALPQNLTKTFASGDRVLSLMDEAPLFHENIDGTPIDFTILDVKDLDFSYADGVQILNGIDFSVKVGEIIGIKGGSGNGKSTLLKLIMRFWDKDSGTLNLEHIDVSDIHVTSLKENVTLISQSTYLFSGTIAENLRIAKPNASDEELITACKKANIHDLIITLEHGYQTTVGGKVIGVSSGEAQRIGLARAFLRDAKLILLDEPTGNVDCINEGIILKSIKENARDKAVIIVSHRDSSLSISNTIYHMKNGKLYM